MKRPRGPARAQRSFADCESDVLVLNDEPAAARRARQWALDRLSTAGLDELRDDVELVVGELVANAMLHAGPPAEVLLCVSAPRARVEVRDRSPAAPLRARQGTETMTGRGLRIVDRVSQSWGVQRQTVGKTIWAELEAGFSADGGGPSQDEIDEQLAEWLGGHIRETPQTVEERYTVRLGDVPTDLLLAAKAHVDDLVREFTLAVAGARAGTAGAVPRHLTELLEAVVDRFTEPRQMIKRQALAAAAAGEDQVTLELTLPLSATDAAQDYLKALDQADTYCRAERLLTLETPPQQRVFRRWYIEELVKQLRAAAVGNGPVKTRTFQQRLLDEIDAVAEAERIAERTTRLNALAAALAGAVTPEDVAERALKEGVAAMRASGGGLLLSAGSRPTLEVPGTVGYDEAVVAGLRQESPDADLPAAHALRTGEAVWLESRQDRDRRFPELVGLEPGTISMCAVPLVVGERCLGALRFSFAQARLFDDDERAFARTMAAHTAQALDRALLYHEQAAIARRLQRTLLPPDLPAIPGVEVASHYDAAEAGEIGGDFYDLIGAISEWTLVVGDVRGKGVDAAALTAMARHTVRSGVFSGLGPGQILELLNVAFLADQHPETFCTAVCGQLSLDNGHATLTLASGGHPEPLVVRAGGAVEPVTCEGMVVGAFPGAVYEPVTVTLAPGDLVFFYTDGITEARRNGAFFGRGRLDAQLAAAAGATAEVVTRQVHTAVESFQTTQRDDMAMLALRLLPEPHARRDDTARQP